ncbi:hypothetical protein SMACR_12717 [Sordaria macrospora]|uniref:Uncharacterized protein n=1 Tax=Sordaria macrospora TaxID=5147 RepID=A0A8S8ZLW6_SORMA|nr:hypothetical protein SMACR_12717 [Sordaria macrospora]WPJ65829.1 hypothetical protein SMAC4_12717 [Sordaria macrospora]
MSLTGMVLQKTIVSLPKGRTRSLLSTTTKRIRPKTSLGHRIIITADNGVCLCPRVYICGISLGARYPTYRIMYDIVLWHY